MEQYLNARVKRYVQNRLFSQINKTKTILGLAGTHPEEYMEVLPEHKQVVLVDFNPVNEFVRRNSLIGEFDLLTNSPAHHKPVTFVDCDFCRSIINNGDDLLYIYNKMKLSKVKNKYIAFTFCIRGVGEHGTIKWLEKHFPELNIPKRRQFINDPDCNVLGYKQYVQCLYNTQYGGRINLYKYRDSGDHMISGIIKL